MTKQLEETFDLPDSNPITQNVEKSIMEIMADSTIPEEVKDKIDAALKQIHGLTDDNDIDELMNSAKESYRELMDLGNNLEARFSGKIFEVAATMLKNAVDLQIHKNDKRLRIIDLQIKKRKLDLQVDMFAGNQNAIPGQARVLDRNALLKAAKEAKTDK